MIESQKLHDDLMMWWLYSKNYMKCRLEYMNIQSNWYQTESIFISDDSCIIMAVTWHILLEIIIWIRRIKDCYNHIPKGGVCLFYFEFFILLMGYIYVSWLYWLWQYSQNSTLKNGALTYWLLAAQTHSYLCNDCIFKIFWVVFRHFLEFRIISVK